jgi:hypothetical protein
MKPLNRPMFKYGGPIKEGIMHGMKEPQAINTVGSPLAPRGNDGRQQYGFPLLGFLGLTGGTAARVGGTRAATALLPRITQGIRNIFQTQKPAPYSPIRIGQSEGGKKLGLKPKVIKGPNVKDTVPKEQVGSVFQTRPYFAGDPTFRLVSGIYKGVTDPKTKGLLASGARFVFSPTGVATGLFYAGGKFFNKEGKEVPPPNEEVVLGDRVTGTSGAPGGGDPGMYLTPRTKEDPKKTKSEENEALKQKYYKIMGLDKMKKDAVYDSLIDASRIVSEEGGDLKGSIKSGTLQNKIIQAISGQLDKSAALKKQIDAAILKGEITKDIKANDPAEKNKARLVEKQIELADQKLSGGSLIENIEAGKKAAGGANSTANVYNSVLRTYKTEPTVLADTTEAAEFRKSDNYTTDAALVKTIVETQGKGAGIYILDKTVVYIDEQGNASTLALG